MLGGLEVQRLRGSEAREGEIDVRRRDVPFYTNARNKYLPREPGPSLVIFEVKTARYPVR